MHCRHILGGNEYYTSPSLGFKMANWLGEYYQIMDHCQLNNVSNKEVKQYDIKFRQDKNNESAAFSVRELPLVTPEKYCP
jgi:hypothetical protein